MVLSDPVVVREVLKNRPFAFSKGVLAEILEPIMGQGLIPAPYAVWKNRRRQLVPGFHKAWLDHMVGLFGDCSGQLVKNLDARVAESADGVAVVDMEERFCSVSLDIIGLAVFNYDFGSTTRESPISKAVYTCLQEAAHRSTFYFPYWNIPFMCDIARQRREFKKNMALINDTLNGLIAKAQKFEGTEDLEELQNRDYSAVNDPSLLRFLVDIRAPARATRSSRARHDAHRGPRDHRRRADVVPVLPGPGPAVAERGSRRDRRRDGPRSRGGARADVREPQKLELTRLCLAERFGCTPSAPILDGGASRRPAPPAAPGADITLIKGMDVFISVWNPHRSPECCEEPLKFDPARGSSGHERTRA